MLTTAATGLAASGALAQPATPAPAPAAAPLEQVSAAVRKEATRTLLNRRPGLRRAGGSAEGRFPPSALQRSAEAHFFSSCSRSKRSARNASNTRIFAGRWRRLG